MIEGGLKGQELIRAWGLIEGRFLEFLRENGQLVTRSILSEVQTHLSLYSVQGRRTECSFSIQNLSHLSACDDRGHPTHL